MRFNGFRRRCVSWVAMLAVVASVLVPTASHALADRDDGGVQWVEVCTRDGVRIEPGPADAEGELPHFSFEHCLYCLTHGENFALEPAVRLAFSFQSEAIRPAPGLLTLFRSDSIWPSAHPRAPPVPLNG